MGIQFERTDTYSNHVKRMENFKGRKSSKENAQVLIRDEEYDLFR